jgi:hypothetical protein
MQGELKDTQSAVDKLHLLIQGQIRIYDQNRVFAKILLLEVRNFPGYFESPTYKIVKIYSKLITDIIEKGQEQGQIRCDIPAKQIRLKFMTLDIGLLAKPSRLARRTKAIQAPISRHTRSDDPLFLKDFEMPTGLGESEKDIPAPEFTEYRLADHEQGHFTPVAKITLVDTKGIQDRLPAHPVVANYFPDPLFGIRKRDPMAGQDLFYSQCTDHFQ